MSPLSEHTFDDKACLTKRQVRDYLSAAMSPEEVAAAEQHFNSCPLCKEAMEGYLGHSDKAVEVLGTLNNDMLTQHVGEIKQQMHEAKILPILTKPTKRKKNRGQSHHLNSLVPVVVLVGVFALFRYEHGNSPLTYYAARQKTTQERQEPKPEKSPLATAYANPAPAPKANSMNYPEEPVARITKVEAPPADKLTSGKDTDRKNAAAGVLQPARMLSPHDTAVVRKPATGGQVLPSMKRIADTSMHKTAMAANLPLKSAAAGTTAPKPIETRTAAQPKLSKPAFGPAEYGHDTPVIRTSPPAASQEKIAPKPSVPAAATPKNSPPADSGGTHAAPGN